MIRYTKHGVRPRGSDTPKAVGDEREHKSCIGFNWGRDLIRVVDAMGFKVVLHVQRLGDAMSAQSKAMYWQARAMELEAMVERMAKAIRMKLYGKNNDYARSTRELEQALAAYAAMKGGDK